MKKSINGYYKFYNKIGIACRIKCSKDIEGQSLIMFKHKNEDTWMYYVPKKEFNNCLEIINHILKNLVNDNMIFKISSLKSKQEVINNGYR